MASPEGIGSTLDTDLYKLTMQCAVLKFFPELRVTYSFTNRTPHMQLSRGAYEWMKKQISNLSNITLADDELAWLRKTCPYLDHGDYLSYLQSFRFKPDQHINLRWEDDPSGSPSDPPSEHDRGSIGIDVAGLWTETILYEIPLLALVSEAYFRFMDTDWTYDGQEALAHEKASALFGAGCTFSEFGTRRRRDYRTQELLMTGLKRAADEHAGAERGGKGAFAGTSNVHFAMRFGVQPVGTVAHEWFMGIAAARLEAQDYRLATEEALAKWIECFGRGVLGVALTDTFGTKAFLETFREPLPEHLLTEEEGSRSPEKRPRFTDVFYGVRQDSGDPKEFVDVMKAFVDRVRVRQKIGIVFSDSLNVEKCIDYQAYAVERGFDPSFGIGTHLTNDFRHKSDPDKKSTPLNIVIKISSAIQNPAIKLSDDMGKNTGDKETVLAAKRQLGYVAQEWADEQARW